MPDTPIGRAHRAANQIIAVHRIEQANRADLLWTHALLGLGAGALILCTGLAANIEQTLGLWTTLVAGLTGVSGGSMLSIGLLMRKARPTPVVEMCGLAILLFWDAFLATCFIIMCFYAPPHFSWPWAAGDPSDGRPYPIAIYLGLFAMLRIHYRALADQRRAYQRLRSMRRHNIDDDLDGQPQTAGAP